MYNPPDPDNFNLLVWDIVCQIPTGKISTYGQIASMIPAPAGVDFEQFRRLGARRVGSAMRQTPPEQTIPWHRVINGEGKISLPAGSTGADEQRALLEMEGAVFDNQGKVDFSVVGWEGPSKEWLGSHSLLAPYLLTKGMVHRNGSQMHLFE